MKEVISYKELIKKAKEAEGKENYSRAIKLYEKAIKAGPSHELPYSRLMIIYRRQKNHQEELRVINEANRFFQSLHESKQKELSGSNKKIVQLSNAFMKSVGLKDKKDKNSYYPEPIPTWQKRKQAVEKKLKK